MRLALRPDGPIDQLGLWFNLAPTPVAETMFGMAMSRVLIAGVKLGLFEELAAGPVTALVLAGRRKLGIEGTRHLLDCLVALGHVWLRADRYALSRRGRRWLDPGSPTNVGRFLAFNADQWEWWSRLEEVVATDQSFQIHTFDAEDPRWRRYVTAMFELARLAAPELARAVPLPAGARRILDVAGGHGWFSTAICRRHPGLGATVLDLPGSARIGREIIATAGMSDRVVHIDGDAFTHPLDGPYDGVLYLQTLRHFTPQQNLELFHRMYAALAPGGTLVVLDYLDGTPDAGAFVALHYYLTTGGVRYTAAELKSALSAVGFSRVRCRSLVRMPFQTLCLATL